MAADDGEIFDVSGPVHLLTCLDWGNELHQRSVAASLIQGVYSLERDHELKRIGQDSRAAPWWERFDFQLYKVLRDHDTRFGAILQHKHANQSHHRHPEEAPRFVVAFRGTMFGKDSTYDDMKHNINYMLNRHEKSSRFHTAYEAVCDILEIEGVEPTNVWIAGHSLGASIAMVTGSKMAKSGVEIETYLFNPPYITPRIENLIKSEKLKMGIRVTRTIVKAGIAKAINRLHSSKDDEAGGSFKRLSVWTPHMFVNPSDRVCNEYIAYYSDREKMEVVGVGDSERIAARISSLSLLSNAIGKKSKPYYLLPTAQVTVNEDPSLSGHNMKAHRICQWWQNHSQWQSNLYKFN